MSNEIQSKISYEDFKQKIQALSELDSRSFCNNNHNAFNVESVLEIITKNAKLIKSLMQHIIVAKDTKQEKELSNYKQYEKLLYIGLENIKKFSLEILEFINKFIMNTRTGTYEDLYIHHEKFVILETIQRKLHHITNTLKYVTMLEDISPLEDIILEFNEIKNLLDNYNKPGSIYLFRHCNKQKGRKKIHTGEEYKGIPKADVTDQAKTVARAICNEIRLSTLPVKIEIRSSEEDRTQIFGEIVMREILRLQEEYVHYNLDKKLIINNPIRSQKLSWSKSREKAWYDPRIAFSNWSNDALKEIGEFIKKYEISSEAEIFHRWWNNEEPFKSEAKHQPDKNTVINNVKEFSDNMYDLANKDDNYKTIVLAFSHSFVLDTLICSVFPEIAKNRNIISTATFIKKECGQYGYLGKWV